MMILTSMLFCAFGIANGNEIGSPSYVFGASLDLCGTIIYRLNLSPRIPLTKALLSVIIEALIVFSNGYENMVLHAPPYPRSRETVTICPFTTKGFCR